MTLEYRPNPAEPFQGDMTSVKSVVMLVFRDAKNPDDELNAWEFWHQRQPSSKQRIIDAETNNMSEQCGIQHIEDVSYNAIAVYWNPLEKPAFLSAAIQVCYILMQHCCIATAPLKTPSCSASPPTSAYKKV